MKWVRGVHAFTDRLVESCFVVLVVRAELGKVKMTLVAPFGRSRDISCSTLVHLMSCRLRGGASFLYILNAATRAPALARRRGGGVGGVIVRQIGKEVPVLLNMNKGGAQTVIRALGGSSFAKMSTVLSIIPCCGGPSRRNVCRRCGTVSRTASLPVILCGIPNHANIGVGTRAALHVTHSFGGIVTIGRTSNSVARVSSVVGGGPTGFSIVSNSSNVAFPLVALKTINVVSIVKGTFPHRFDHVMHLTLRKSCTGTLAVRRGFTRLFGLLFMSNGPTKMGTVLGMVKVVRGGLHLPLIPAEVAAFRTVHGVLSRLGVGYWNLVPPL